MASTFSSSSRSSSSSSGNTYVEFLQQAKHNFWTSNPSLSEDERNRAWFQLACQPTQASMAHQIPRSMPFDSSNMTPLSTSGHDFMDRTRSAPVMNRSDSAMNDSNLHHSASAYSGWQSMSQEPAADYALYSHPLQPLPDTGCYTNSIAEYSVDHYVRSCIQPDSTATLALPQHSQQLQLTPNLQSSSSSDASSPTTPSTALMTPATQSSNMSRQGSCNAQFLNQISMLRLPSDSSCTMPILHEDGTFPCSFTCATKPISESADASHFLTLTGSSSEAFLSSSLSVSASVPALASSDNNNSNTNNDQSYLAEDMRRSTSAVSSEGYSSDVSAPCSTSSRQSQREREIIAQAASCKIAPKASHVDDETKSTSSNAQMTRIRSEDGSSRAVGVLPKAPYVRPQHPKMKCNLCNERPDGFRGTHELERHIARAHAPRRKGYICVDSSADNKFLANCKHCRNKKVYGAYYNAAAHLRRAHFHPRKRGRKGRSDEKRGGIGGGDDPPMEYLKQNWIKAVEVDNHHHPTPQSPESNSDNEAPPASEHINVTDMDMDNNNNNNNAASFDFKPAAAAAATASSYTHVDNNMPLMHQVVVPVDANQYMDFDMSMHANAPMIFDNSAFFDPNLASTAAAASTTTDLSSFQFDAYMGP